MSRRNPGEINLTEQHDSFIKQLLQKCQKTELYQSVLKKKLPDTTDIKSIQFIVRNHRERYAQGIELPDITYRSLTFFLAYEGIHDNIIEFLVAHFPNQLGEAMKGYAESGNHRKVQSLLVQYPHSVLIFSAMYGYAQSYRILHLAQLVTASVSIRYITEPECEIFLMPQLPKHYSQYQSKYLLINNNPAHFYYINSKSKRQSVRISHPSQFLQKLAYYENESFKFTKKTNPIALTRKQAEEFIHSAQSYSQIENFRNIVKGLHPERTLKDNLQNNEVLRLLTCIDSDEGRHHIMTGLKERLGDEAEEKKWDLILSEAVEMRTALQGLCQYMGILSPLFPKELIYLIVCYSAAIKQEECESLLTHLTATLQPTPALNIPNLLSWFNCPLVPTSSPSSGCSIC